MPRARRPGADRQQLAGLAVAVRHRPGEEAGAGRHLRARTSTSYRGDRPVEPVPAGRPALRAAGPGDCRRPTTSPRTSTACRCMMIPCITGQAGQRCPAFASASAWGSLLPAVWSFMLAARERGLGTAWTTHPPAERRRAEGGRAARHPRRQSPRPACSPSPTRSAPTSSRPSACRSTRSCTGTRGDHRRRRASSTRDSTRGRTPARTASPTASTGAPNGLRALAPARRGGRDRRRAALHHRGVLRARVRRDRAAVPLGRRRRRRVRARPTTRCSPAGARTASCRCRPPTC